ncbi:MAG TPA: hypothetical protein HA359_01845 [Candidatus Poseidoniaceae archaeon]|nr:MAG TPA: hypothetical protein D7H84_01845 [Candidatus Poseidoniales archaeon]DAC59991.1 MAG TPA: hypothetical protein D7I03_02990 [Candidatus Poseidoniales archaeon]HII22978.1 hypothetical protein [Candidatus Poseidoniaceae archaeon]HII50287.1 hypothetical protein [Candidatus Poseidoniaceae archaeon]|tara:strand:- start:7055 stop:8305 length:1251 start_codon:yes stop_codon:yes gene_type:complete
MSEPIYSPDGKFMWSGSEWIPAPPKASQTLNMQDSVVGGDVVHNTVINNDVDAVTNAVITALERLGMVNKNQTSVQVEEMIQSPIIPELEVGTHVEYFSPTNERWLDRCTVTKINDDGSYDVDVPKSSGVESKQGLLIGDGPRNIRRADDALNKGDRVLVNWKNYGTYFPGKIAEVQPHHTYMIHFDDGDVESGVPPSRIAKQPDSEATQAYVEQISKEEQELIDSFKVFDENNSGTIHASKLFEILTQMGDPLDVSEAQEMFNEMGISMDSELNYKDLAKIMVQPFEAKSEVIIQNAKIIGDSLHGFVHGHPKLGDTEVKTSAILSMTYDNRATARVETNNTIYIVGPTGWEIRPQDHPFNKSDYAAGQQVKVEWKGSWWDGLIREVKGDNYLIHYVGFDSSWDEWVDDSRLQNL